MLRSRLTKLFGFTNDAISVFVELALSVLKKYSCNPSAVSVRNRREEANFFYFKDLFNLFINRSLLNPNNLVSHNWY